MPVSHSPVYKVAVWSTLCTGWANSATIEQLCDLLKGSTFAGEDGSVENDLHLPFCEFAHDVVFGGGENCVISGPLGFDPLWIGVLNAGDVVFVLIAVGFAW